MKIDPRLLPSVMIVLDIVASGVYLMNRDIKHSLYWLLGAGMIALVTF